MAASEEVVRAHSCLIVAKPPGCGSSELTPSNVSTHGLPETTSFANLEALAKAAEKAESYVGTVEKDLVFSAHLTPKTRATDDDDAPELPPKKRRRFGGDEDADRVFAARERLAKSASNLPSEELDVAQRVLTKLVKDLRGPEGEIVVQSSAILGKKLGVSDSRPRVVVAARLNAGIEINVKLLKQCLGECWKDGLLTTLPTLHGIGKLELPLTEEATASAFFGNATILLVTSVPTK
jgi:hypothetical protein